MSKVSSVNIDIGRLVSPMIPPLVVQFTVYEEDAVLLLMVKTLVPDTRFLFAGSDPDTSIFELLLFDVDTVNCWFEVVTTFQ